MVLNWNNNLCGRIFYWTCNHSSQLGHTTTMIELNNVWGDNYPPNMNDRLAEELGILDSEELETNEDES